jgi:hypothetical protein
MMGCDLQIKAHKQILTHRAFSGFTQVISMISDLSFEMFDLAESRFRQRRDPTSIENRPRRHGGLIRTGVESVCSPFRSTFIFLGLGVARQNVCNSCRTVFGKHCGFRPV